MRRFALGFMLVLVCVPRVTPAAEEEGFTPLFNGRDLSGWVPVQVAPSTFTVKDGIIVSTGVPTGVMRTDKQYENYVLELEWKHITPGGNAGLFVFSDPITAVGQPFTRAIEIQILDGRESEGYTSHGDVFSIHGARMKPDRPHPQGWERCLPSEKRAKPAGQWNHYRVECNDGSIKLAVNGKVVSGASQCRPRKGYICLESEGGECHFRNIRIKQLPSTNPKPEEIAKLDEGFKSLYTGVDLSGWKADEAAKAHWQAKDWTLVYDGKAQGPDRPVWTEKEFGDFVLIADWRVTDKDVKPDATRGAGLCVRGSEKPLVLFNGGTGARGPGEWNRVVVTARGGDVNVVLNDKPLVFDAPLYFRARGAVGLTGGGTSLEVANLYVRELK